MTDLDDHRPDRALLDRLERHLDHVSDDVRLRSSSVTTAVARARQRQRRRNAAAAGTSLVAVVAAIATVAIVQQPGPRPADGDRTGTTITTATTVPTTAVPVTTVPAPTPPPTTEPATLPSTAIVDAGADATELVVPDGADPTTWVFGPRIAWAGEADGVAPDVFVSDDAVVWRAVGSTPLGELWGGARDDEGVMRLVGSTGGAAPIAVLATSTDDGGSWNTIELPIDLGPESAAAAPGGVSLLSATLASVDGTTVIGVSDSGFRRWLLTVLADGTVIDAAETGLDLGDQLPLAEATRFVNVALGDDEGFVAVGGFSSDVTTLTFWTSEDGRSWTETGSTEQYVDVVGRIGDRLVSVGSPWSTSTDVTTWNALAPIGTGADNGGPSANWTPLLATMRDDRLAVLLFSDGSQAVASFVKDGILVRIAENLDTSFFDEATGEYLGGFVGTVYDGPVRTVGASFELLDEAGEVRVSISVNEATAAVQGLADLEDQPDQWAIATTTDLSTWSLTDITDLVPGDRAGGLTIDIVGDQVVATMALQSDSGLVAPFTVIRTPPF